MNTVGGQAPAHLREKLGVPRYIVRDRDSRWRYAVHRSNNTIDGVLHAAGVQDNLDIAFRSAADIVSRWTDHEFDLTWQQEDATWVGAVSLRSNGP
jgi:hypothetical protein